MEEIICQFKLRLVKGYEHENFQYWNNGILNVVWFKFSKQLPISIIH